jgi:hypothetical protein
MANFTRIRSQNPLNILDLITNKMLTDDPINIIILRFNSALVKSKSINISREFDPVSPDQLVALGIFSIRQIIINAQQQINPCMPTRKSSQWLRRGHSPKSDTLSIRAMANVLFTTPPSFSTRSSKPRR